MKGEGKSSTSADKVVEEIRRKGGEAVANYGKCKRQVVLLDFFVND